jgi:hypothetical protein
MIRALVWRRSPERARFRALRDLYNSFLAENSAEARGRRLLLEWLSPEQLRQFSTLGYFDVLGSDSGKRYRIQCGTSTNVIEIDDAGGAVMGWCFVPKGALVSGDVMLAQKVALETGEHSALAVANRFQPSYSHVRRSPRRW